LVRKKKERGWSSAKVRLPSSREERRKGSTLKERGKKRVSTAVRKQNTVPLFPYKKADGS